MNIKTLLKSIFSKGKKDIADERKARTLADLELSEEVEGKQNIISDLDTIRSGASLGATAVQDDNYVHTDNNFTNTDKGNISKALYFKGAFDSEDGKTRRTGVANKENYKLAYDSTNHVALFIGSPITENNPSMVLNINGYSQTAETSWASMPNMSYSQTNYEGTCYFSFKNTSFTEASAYEFLNALQVEYQLATSYTDNPIENQSILPLDTNMASKIRQGVVDGLNLFDLQSAQLVQYPTLSNTISKVVNGVRTIGDWFGGVTVPCKPYTTYYFNYTFSSGAYNRVEVTIEGTDITLTNGAVFKTANQTSVNIHFFCQHGSTTGDSTYTNILLVESNHAYPYSDFNQKEHITNPQAELLKGEEEKSRNLFDINSIGLETGSINPDNGVNISSSAKVRTKGKVPVKPSTTYTLSAINVSTDTDYVYFYTSSGSYISYGIYNHGLEAAYTFTTPNNCYYIRFIFKTSISNTLNIMLNKGTIALSYQPYCGDILHEADPLIINNIVDTHGRNRFIEGALSNINSKLSPSYAKWSLSGTHLMIALECSVDATQGDVTLNNDEQMAYAFLPSWIMNKISNISGVYLAVEKKSTYYWSDVAASPEDTGTLMLRKLGIGETPYLAIYKYFGAHTFPQGHKYTFRIQFDLLIDID